MAIKSIKAANGADAGYTKTHNPLRIPMSVD